MFTRRETIFIFLNRNNFLVIYFSIIKIIKISQVIKLDQILHVVLYSTYTIYKYKVNVLTTVTERIFKNVIANRLMFQCCLSTISAICHVIYLPNYVKY